MSELPEVPEGPIPSDWSNPQLAGIKVSLVGLDEFGMPFDRRGVAYRFPTTQNSAEEVFKFASTLGENVRDTILSLFEISKEERDEQV